MPLTVGGATDLTGGNSRGRSHHPWSHGDSESGSREWQGISPPRSAQQWVDGLNNSIASVRQRADPSTQLSDRNGDDFQRVQDNIEIFEGESRIETRIGNGAKQCLAHQRHYDTPSIVVVKR